jgi:beta-N-acetylhexosaminidase
MKNLLKVLGLLSGAALLWGCGSDAAQVEEELASMTLREKVGMMFFVRPEALDTDVYYDSPQDLTDISLQEVNDRMRETARNYPMGGVILFGHNIKDEAQLNRFITDLQQLSGRPLLGIDEEGGRVARIGRNPNFNVPKFPSAASLAAAGRTSDVENAANTIGKYLKSYGFDVDFAPVADVNTNPQNIVIGDRAFADNPREAAPMVKAYLKGLQKAGVVGCLKHFPGHGDTQADTHFGYAMSRKKWDEIRDCEMIPFKAGIQAGAHMIMTAHISLPNVTGSNIPSTLSPLILQDKLRNEMNFNGVIITDAMEMGAIIRQYSVEDASIMAIKAGVDMLLCVREYPLVFNAVLNAVQRGEISESRIDESVRRILHLRHAAGLTR